MDRRLRPVFLLGALLAGPVSSAHAQAAPSADPAEIQRQITASRLEPEGAVAVKSLNLDAGLATFHLEEGVLLPARRIGAKSVEMVFLGSGRITVDPPDEVEAGQLELFTGGRRLDEEFKEAVLVLGPDAAAAAMLRRPGAQLDPALAKRGAELYAKWKASPERKLLHVDGDILVNAVGDPYYQGFFAGWFRGRELGDFLYLVEPDSHDQVTLGHFVPLQATEKEKRKIQRQLQREQRKGRLIGLELADLGQWDTWFSAALRGKDRKPRPGTAAFEPRKYTLDVTLTDHAEHLAGRARIDLKPVVRPSRAVALRLDGDLAVHRVTDGADKDLFFLRSGRDLTVLLPRAPAADEAVAVVVEYSGKVVEKEGRTFTLLDTQEWYPHAGSRDRALYDVTFHWPHRLDLLSCGRRMGGGEGADGMSWERRTLDLPVAGFAFEVGHFKTETVRAGHVEVTLAFDPEGNRLSRDVREEIARSVTDSLAYFEELFGPYPLDQLTVVTVPRYFSQSMLGFVTLSDLMMLDLGIWNIFFGLEDRRTVVAHEVAHQWWGHLVGWESYRDQWISEAMATYAALLYGKNRLKGFHLGGGPTAGWQEALTHETPDGRPIESLGPVVLGERLQSSRSDEAYQAIIYKKGAVILDMLARSVGEENFPKVLRQIVKVVANGAISTEDFLSLVERITQADLGWFSSQYVYGTGLSEVYYTYRFEPKGVGAWVVKGQARQHTPYRFRYRVVKTKGGGLEVAREVLEQVAVKGSLVVPVEIAVYDPSLPLTGKDKKKQKGANATVTTHVLIRGETTDFAIDLKQEPKDLWMDYGKRIFGRFFNESRNPKRVLFYQGLDAAAAGKSEEAEKLYDQALQAAVRAVEQDSSDKHDYKREGRMLDAEIALGLARLYLEQGRDAQAAEQLDRARKVLGLVTGWAKEEQKVLYARLEMHRGDLAGVFKRLHKGFFGGGVDSTEGYLLLAISAQATGHQEELDQALKVARENGADVALLAGR